ncbi:calcium-transporting P [Eremomyces bilateralis CBS 781.70]|uniref:Calcium-transporting ATPase n=1 Tax=Eremomyces bilateralis CBS 781.70 TaxID=1392243 RepID=A0A6G1FUH0_9PEZI|nr:calcium-transporting P [Eremomyces bilateralis CBS 781.70]KAF1809348.1 calcium-transporting P [Eremomyces bilateralis CBS 781.70]
MSATATPGIALQHLSLANGRVATPKIDSTTSSRSGSRAERLRRPSVGASSRASAQPTRLTDCQTATSSYSILTPSETALRLRTSLTHGLSPSEIVSRLHVYGSNELPREEPEPLWLRFLKQFKETLILLLLGSAAISFLMGNYDDAISIAVAVTIVVSVGFVQEYRSEKSLEALNQLVPHFAHVIRADGAIRPDRSARTTPGVPKGREGEDDEIQDTAKSLEAAEATSTTLTGSQLVPGDLVLFHTGDRIPADIRITHSADLSIDESNLTGENEPVSKSPATLVSHASSTVSREPSPNGTASIYASPAAGTVGADIRLNDQTNIAFMGTLVRSGHGSGIVIATGGSTEFGAISASLQEIESPRTPLQLSMDRLGKELSYLSFAVIAFIMLLGVWRGWEFLEMFTIGVSLAVAAIPEGLPIIVTVTLALGVLRMSKRGAIVRRLPSVETLGSVNVVCSDKTGTLTTNHMTVTKIWHFTPGATSEPISISAKQQSLSTSDLDFATRTILRIGNIVNNGRLMSGSSSTPASAASAAILSSSASDPSSAKSRWVGQPTDVALLDLLDAFGEADVRDRIGPRRDETPFSSERKWMGCVIHPGPDNPNGYDVAYAKGALEQVLLRCDTYITTDGKEVILDEARREEAIKAAEKMAQEGLRVLGFASGPKKSGKLSPSNLYKGLAFSGLVGMNDPPRPNVDRSIRRLLAGGVRVIMITGDAEHTAVAIAKKLGIPLNFNSAIGPSVLRGDQLDQMSEEELSQAIGTTTIFARTSPEHKMKIVRALQARGDVVAMTGDGVNDAPALKKADIGVSMGRLGTDVAKEAADMILTDDDFSTILNAIEEGKGIFYNIQNFLTFQLSTSAAALGLVMVSTVAGFKNPLNAMQILWINILMDGPPAQSLGVEPVDPAVMKLPPRSRHARVLTPQLLRRVIQSSLIIMLGTLSTYILEMADGQVVTARDTTMTFTCFVLFDMFNALTCRSEAKSVLRGELPIVGKGSNKMFNYAVTGSLVGQCAVIYFPPLQSIFQTEAIGILDWIRLLLVASLVFWADEGRKAYKRWNAASRTASGYSLNV